MKILATALIIVLVSIAELSAQVQIEFDEPPIYAREQSGQQPTYAGDYDDSGYFIIDGSNSSVTVVSERTGGETVYEFTEFERIQGVGNFMGYGTSVDGSVFNFVPQENLLLFGYKEHHILNISLSDKITEELLGEMGN